MKPRSVTYTSSPLLARRTPPWRSKFVWVVIALGFIALLARAFYVQVWNSKFFIRQGDVRFVRTIELPADRGEILDRNGVVLAFSTPTPSIWADPEDVRTSPQELTTLANLLEMPTKDLAAKLSVPNRQFAWLKRQVPEPVAQKIMALKLPGIYQRMEYSRSYPAGESAAQLVGFTNLENQGQDGLELTFNKQLGGKNGFRRVIKNQQGRPVENIGDVIAPIPGNNLQLSIDSRIQYFAYTNIKSAVESFKAKDGSIVVLDAKNGSILAMANYPSFSPENRTDLTGPNIRNRALTDTFEPGSTMKPLVVALGLQKGVITPDTMIETSPGYIYMAGFRIRDTEQNGLISIGQVIQKSSNIGAVKIAMRMTPKDMWDMFRLVGFGQKPQLPFPGIANGRIRPYQSWRPVEQATMAYGYGLSVSLLQLAHAYMIFAKNGEIIPLSILKTSPNVSGIPVIDPQHIIDVRKMLALVTAPGGSAPKAQVPGYSTGGKTGTAHKQEGKGYARNKYRSFFVGLAPISDPRIVIAITVDQPSQKSYYGGAIAGPVFSKTVSETLHMMGVKPDIAVQAEIVAAKPKSSEGKS